MAYENLHKRLIAERMKIAKQMSGLRVASANAWARWENSGMSDTKHLQAFFDNHYHVIELTDRIGWLDTILSEEA